jgi:6-phosphofructokinase 2
MLARGIKMTDIVPVTFNPAVDVATSVDVVLDTQKLRCAPARRDPGGGGINVARVVQRLGGDCVAFYLAGGPAGGMLSALLNAEQVTSECVPIAGETRENFSVRENATGREFRFVLPGPTVEEHEWSGLIDRVCSLSPAPAYLVLSGSLPPGVPVDAYARFAHQMHSRGTRAVIHTSGQALAATLAAPVFLLKASLGELRALSACELSSETEWRDAALKLVTQGRVEVVALTLGAEGALIVTRERCIRLPGMAVPVASSIGAGDSFVGGFIWALSRAATLDDAARYGLAAASAALLSEGTGLCEATAVAAMYRRVCDAAPLTPLAGALTP